MLKIKNLNYNFRKKVIINDFSYYFSPGIYGLLGPNGAGKTTLMRCITGVYSTKPDTLLYEGQEAIENEFFLKRMSYLPQKFGLFRDLTVKEMMLMMSSLKGIDIKNNEETVEDCVARVNLSDKLNEKVKTLSGGMIRRLGIAQTLLNDPKIIIFDEPTAGLDVEERLRFKNIISEICKDKIIIISTHIVEDIEDICKEVIIMKNGIISFSGSCQAIASKAMKKTYILPKEQLSYIKDNYHIQKQFEKDDQTFIKILTNAPLSMNLVEFDIKLINPTIEDGYICILKDI